MFSQSGQQQEGVQISVLHERKNHHRDRQPLARTAVKTHSYWTGHSVNQTTWPLTPGHVMCGCVCECYRWAGWRWGGGSPSCRPPPSDTAQCHLTKWCQLEVTPHTHTHTGVNKMTLQLLSVSTTQLTDFYSSSDISTAVSAYMPPDTSTIYSVHTSTTWRFNFNESSIAFIIYRSTDRSTYSTMKSLHLLSVLPHQVTKCFNTLTDTYYTSTAVTANIPTHTSTISGISFSLSGSSTAFISHTV